MSVRPVLRALWTVLVMALCAPALAATNVMIDLREDLSGTNYAGPYLRGTQGVLYAYFHNCPNLWCDFTDATFVDIQLPPGLAYVSHQGFSPTWMNCSAGVAGPAGQTVRCQGAGLSGNPNSINKFSAVELTLDVAADAPLGAMRIVAAVDDEDQPATLAGCLIDAAPPWCDVMHNRIETPPQPELVFEFGGFSPDAFDTGDDTGTVRATFRNIGAAAAPVVHVQVQLPRGVYWRASGTGASPATPACSSSGAIDPGFTLQCTLSAALAAGAQGWLQLGLTPGALSAGTLPVLFAIDAAAAPVPGLLDICAADPDRPDCLLVEIPMRTGCGTRHGPDGLYCDGYEATP